MSDLERAAAGMICAGFVGTTVPDEVRSLVRRGVRSWILMGRNCESPEQVRRLCAELRSAAGEPVLICIDQEGGRVQRLREPFPQFPSMRELGQRNDRTDVRRAGIALGGALRALGINMNLAPVLDVDSNPANPVIGDRAFSSDPRTVAELGCAMIEGLQGAGVAACGKHFPGHGDTSVDSHLDLPRLSHGMDRMNSIELLPFAAAIRAGVVAVMTAHVVFDAIDPLVPATMSRAVVHDLLRTGMGFRGLVISDDLEMGAIIKHVGIEESVVRGAQSGIDLFLVCHELARQEKAILALARALERGHLAAARVAESNVQRRNLLGWLDRARER
jgi:beta-N-acetylhexosaminidase